MTQSCILETGSSRQRAAPVAPESWGAGEPEEVAPGVFFLHGGTFYFERGTQDGAAGAVRSLMCNNGWVVLGDHVLLIDSNMPGRTDALLAAIRQTTKKPVRYVLNTHVHGDHIYGNRSIHARTDATIIASEGMVADLKRFETGLFGGPPGRWEQVAKLRPDVAATPLMVPHRTFADVMVLEGGGMRVELRFLGHGHTHGDAVAWLPQHGVLFAGDLVVNGPFNIVRDSEMVPWIQTLHRMEALAPSIVCPGHGVRGGLSSLTEQRLFFEALVQQVGQRVRVGATLTETLGDLPAIRQALLADPVAAKHVIPASADLPVLSLQAQVERTYSQFPAIRN